MSIQQFHKVPNVLTALLVAVFLIGCSGMARSLWATAHKGTGYRQSQIRCFDHNG